MRFAVKLTALSLVFIALLGSVPARAERGCCRDVPNWYFGLTGQLTFIRDSETKFKGLASPNPATVSFDPGFGLSGNVGYRIQPWLRAELEGSYYTSEVGKTTNVTLPAATAGQKLRSQKVGALMANAYYDIRNSTFITPYLGAGIGVMRVRGPLDAQLYSGATLVEEKKETDWAMGYQFMAGVSYNLHEEGFPSPVEIVMGYRYVAAVNPEVEFKTLGGVAARFEHRSHNAELGFRFYF